MRSLSIYTAVLAIFLVSFTYSCKPSQSTKETSSFKKPLHAAQNDIPFGACRIKGRVIEMETVGKTEKNRLLFSVEEVMGFGASYSALRPKKHDTLQAYVGAAMREGEIFNADVVMPAEKSRQPRKYEAVSIIEFL